MLPTLEPLRWFDYWLKGIDNGIADEPGVIFATTDLRGRGVWKGADHWPLPEVEQQEWFLTDAGSGTVASALDGSLARDAGEETTADYTVDYEVGLGDRGRMRFMLRDEYIRHPTWSREPAAAPPSPGRRWTATSNSPARRRSSSNSPPRRPTAPSTRRWRRYRRTATWSTSPRAG